MSTQHLACTVIQPLVDKANQAQWNGQMTTPVTSNIMMSTDPSARSEQCPKRSLVASAKVLDASNSAQPLLSAHQQAITTKCAEELEAVKKTKANPTSSLPTNQTPSLATLTALSLSPTQPDSAQISQATSTQKDSDVEAEISTGALNDSDRGITCSY
jgi:hypothetical protein